MNTRIMFCDNCDKQFEPYLVNHDCIQCDDGTYEEYYDSDEPVFVKCPYCDSAGVIQAKETRICSLCLHEENYDNEI